MYCIRGSILSVLVLAFGLAACSPDNPKKREDTWRMAPPELILPEEANDGLRSRMKIGEASQKQVSLNAELSFGTIDPSVVFEVDSSCIRDGQIAEEFFTFTASNTVLLSALIPGQTLLSNVENSEDSLECSFDFVAINVHKSRHRFLLPSVKLIGANTFGNLIVSEKLRQISPGSDGAMQTIEVNNLDQLAIDSNLRNGTAELICADFTSRASFMSVDTVDWLKLAYKQPINVLEKVLRKFRQPCRIALRDESGKRSETSAKFILRYPPPPLNLSVIQPLHPNGASKHLMPVLHVQLRNDSNVDQYLSLPADGIIGAGCFPMSRVPFGGQNQDYVIGGMGCGNKTIINFELSGTDKILVNNGKKYFVIKANSLVSLNIMAQHGSYIGSQGHLFGGFYFTMSAPFLLERYELSGQLEEEIGSNRAVSVETVVLSKVLEHHFDGINLYVPSVHAHPNWAENVRRMQKKN